MRCPNCNSRIENEADVCRYCNYDITGKRIPTHEEQYAYNAGYSNMKEIETSHKEQIDYSKKYSNVDDDLTMEHKGLYEYSTRYSKYNGSDSSKEKYRDAYIDRNRNLVDAKFNIFAFLFGPFYLFYRNVNKLGIITLIIYFIFLGNPIIILFINILLGVEFKKYYYNDMDNKIKKILKDNQDKSNTEIIELVKEKGNTKNGLKILLLGLGLLLMITMLAYMHNKNNIKEEELASKLKISIDKLDYKLPNKYNVISNKDTYKAFDNNNSNHNCIISISTKDYKYIKDEISYIKTIDNIKDISKKIINNNTWYYYKIDNRDIYVIKKDDYFYKVIFNTYKDKDGICLDNKNDFINSLDF